MVVKRGRSRCGAVVLKGPLAQECGWPQKLKKTRGILKVDNCGLESCSSVKIFITGFQAFDPATLALDRVKPQVPGCCESNTKHTEPCQVMHSVAFPSGGRYETVSVCKGNGHFVLELSDSPFLTVWSSSVNTHTELSV